MNKSVFDVIGIYKFIGFICLVLLISLIFFYPIILGYFSQDDFHHLHTIMDRNLSDIPSFFITWQEGQTFYRPLSREIFNLLMYKTFGLNPLPFHLVNFLQIITISTLTFFIIKRFTQDITTAILTSLFYIGSAVHSIELYYLGSVQQLFATIFLLISLLLYLQYKKNSSIQILLISIISYLAALLSHGMAVMFPGMLLLLEIISIKNIFRLINRQVLFNLIPFFLIDVIYIFFSSLTVLPNQSTYQPIVSLKPILNTLFWYCLWSFNLPEMLVDFVGPKLQINPKLFIWYHGYLNTVLPLLTILFLAIGAVFLKYFKYLIRNKNLYIFVIFFILSLSPFLIFPKHKFIFYMSFSTVWFSAILALIISYIVRKNNFGKMIAGIFLVLHLMISYQTIQINKITHWAAKRSVAAKFILSEIKTIYHNFPKGSVLYIKNDPLYPDIAKEWGSSSKQAFYILSGSDALRLLFNDKTIKVYYEDVLPLPKNIDRSEIITYIAKFPY